MRGPYNVIRHVLAKANCHWSPLYFVICVFACSCMYMYPYASQKSYVHHVMVTIWLAIRSFNYRSPHYWRANPQGLCVSVSV